MLIAKLIGEQFDIITAGMNITDERDELIDFAGPHYPPRPSVYLARVGSGDEALEGALGAAANTVFSDYLTAQGITFRALDGGIDAASASASVQAVTCWTPSTMPSTR